MGRYTNVEKAEMVLLAGPNSYRDVREIFHKNHPDRPKPSVSMIANLLEKFKKTGSTSNLTNKDRPRVNPETERTVLKLFKENPKASIRRLAKQSGTSKGTVQRALQLNGLRNGRERNKTREEREADRFTNELNRLFADECTPLIGDDVCFEVRKHWCKKPLHASIPMSSIKQEGDTRRSPSMSTHYPYLARTVGEILEDEDC